MEFGEQYCWGLEAGEEYEGEELDVRTLLQGGKGVRRDGFEAFRVQPVPCEENRIEASRVKKIAIRVLEYSFECRKHSK